MPEVLASLVCGGMASVVAKSAVAPFERTKIILQTQNHIVREPLSGHAVHQPYRGTMDALMRLPQEQGPLAYWRGNLTNCLRVVPTYALRFALFGQYRQLVSQKLEPGLARELATGALAGGTTLMVTYPLDLLRTRLSASVEARSPTGIVQLSRSIVEQNGPIGLYRGVWISLLEITPYTAISFGGYEWLKSNATRRFEEQLSAEKASNGTQWALWAWTRLGCGWVAGVSASLFCYPADTVKRRMMLSSNEHGIMGCVRELYVEGGLRSFYRGCLLNALNSGPALAITMTANETLSGVLKPYLN